MAKKVHITIIENGTVISSEAIVPENSNTAKLNVHDILVLLKEYTCKLGT